MKLQPLNLEELADEIIRMEYPTYEQTTIPQMKNSIIRKKQQIKFILEQRVKSAVLGLKKEIESKKISIEKLSNKEEVISDTKEKFVSDFNFEIDDILKLIKKWFKDVIE